MIKPPALAKKFNSMKPGLSNSNRLAKQLKFDAESDEEGFSTPTFAMPYPTERKRPYWVNLQL